MSSVNYLIRLPDSGYTAQLRGVSGTVTDGETVNGVYDSNWDAFVFNMEKSGLYELWVDPAGGSTYSKDSIVSGSYGKVILGYDFAESLEPF